LNYIDTNLAGKTYQYMSQTPLNIDQLRELIHKGEAKDPLVFLESVMGGQDPRKTSGIYKLIMEIDSFTGGDIAPTDWTEIVDYVLNHAKYHEVSLNESTQAAKTIAEYLHAKRKQIEKLDGMSSGNASSTPLSEEEIELFKERFNDDF